MMLRQISRDLTRRLPTWEAPLKWSMGIAIALLALLLILGFGGPSALRLPARMGAFGTLVTLQLLFLWANRREISPYHQAQEQFIAGDYAAALAILEQIPESGRASADALVLLGNTYRHLGQIEKSRLALERALALQPRHHLALYSRGMCCLLEGNFVKGGEFIRSALSAGAPAIVRFELGQCYYLQCERMQALSQFTAARELLSDEPAKRTLLRYYLAQLDANSGPAIAAPEEHLRFWRGQASKYRSTAYGKHLEGAVAWLCKSA